VLQTITQQFRVGQSRVNSALADIAGLASLSTAKGYLARAAQCVRADEVEGTVEVCAVACAPACWDLMQRDPDIARSLSQLSADYGTVASVSYSRAANSDGLDYAGDPPWTQLYLECDCLFGITPVRLSDKRLVARPRLNLGVTLANDLWSWEIEYGHIYGCWLESSDYEKWAESELTDPTSKLNMRGSMLATHMAAKLACPVTYLVMAVP